MLAAMRHGRNSIGYEIDKTYLNAARKPLTFHRHLRFRRDQATCHTILSSESARPSSYFG